MKILLAAVVVASLTGGCSYLNRKSGLEDDNFIEEAIEEIIESKIGLDIDLSPESSE